jgi:hypothetical protein
MTFSRKLMTFSPGNKGNEVWNKNQTKDQTRDEPGDDAVLGR